MDAPTRLVTFVDVAGGCTDRQISVSARVEAVLAGGGRLLLQEGRGWSISGPADLWATTSAADVAATTRTAVGPDAPYGDRSVEDMAADHWVDLAAVLRRQGVVAYPDELRRLPQEVVLSERLVRRLGVEPSGLYE
jgi:hypothetical protein